jgi:hypothetical protein
MQLIDLRNVEEEVIGRVVKALVSKGHSITIRPTKNRMKIGVILMIDTEVRNSYFSVDTELKSYFEKLAKEFSIE